MSDILDPITQRGRILQSAIFLTEHDRNDDYGSPLINMACASTLKGVFWSFANTSKVPMSNSMREALDMIMTKLSRIACGGEPGRDTFIDIAAYSAIAGEAYIEMRKNIDAESKKTDDKMQEEELGSLMDTEDEKQGTEELPQEGTHEGGPHPNTMAGGSKKQPSSDGLPYDIEAGTLCRAEDGSMWRRIEGDPNCRWEYIEDDEILP